MKVMLDTNILVSAFLFKSKVINKLIDKLSKEHEIIICSYTVEQLNELIITKFKVDVKELDEFLTNFPFELVYSPKKVKEKLFEIRDENDYIILHTAIIEDVDIFITGDKDFFDVNIEKPEIITVKDFFEKY
ncbi:MAG: putative toxin-antitoxin system toxin component, PIN family [Clostridia bacterium]|nr:putative toxin-antitoxin system toxin component, PIN family [Clostridia bacterium]